MYEVTCLGCHRAVEITPEAATCPACGEELQQLLLPDQVADYFLARVQSLSLAKDPNAALAAAERGLEIITSSHLRLLAAILAQRTGRYDQMRRHVAAIPVDDALRGEAEWLLRGHQARHRAAKTSAPNGASSTFVDELLGRGDAAAAPTRAGRAPGLASLAVVLTLAGLATFGWAVWNMPADPSGPRTMEAAPAVTAVAQTVEPPNVPVVNLLPTPTPTPIAPPDMVVVPAEQAKTADADVRHVVVIASTALDLPSYLRGLGYSQLAELAVSARLQDDVLTLQGFVRLDAQRRQLIGLMQEMPGVREVNAVDLLLRPLPIYVVQEGDTMWTIVNDIYGGVDRLDEFIAHNADVLAAPDALVPGMTLKVLPIR
jgi:hypothetical protein